MLHWTDWLSVALFLALSLGISLYYARRAGQSAESYFLGGRSLPWWLAGLSMVATTFAADTPLAVTELVRANGVAGNWLWWNMLAGGLLTTFFFARLWRRAAVTTDLEFITLRYSGRPAQVLRGPRAGYLGLLMNSLIIGWVNLAMVTVLQVFFDLDGNTALLWVAALMLITTAYTSLSGLMGVVVTDAFQFVLAMGGCIILAVIVLQTAEVGGLSGLVAQVPPQALQFFPSLGATDAAAVGPGLGLGLAAFLSMVGLQWWASWYPGAEPGGGGYVVQRMLAAKNERHAVAATLLFQIFHYAVRPWPWILVGLATFVLYPELATPADFRAGYVYAIRDYLPEGLRGLLLAAFLAAYMSTLSTQLNWGASYLINDLYQPYLRPGQASRHYVAAGRVAVGLLLLAGLGLTLMLESIAGAWELLLQGGAGIGLVLMLRWYWWRVSAWSELTATVVPFVCIGVYKLLIYWGIAPWLADFGLAFPLTVGITTVAWLAATYLTPPTDAATLQAFYRQVRPQGAWGAVAQTMAAEPNPYPTPAPLWVLAACWLLGMGAVYGALLGVGSLLLSTATEAALYLGVAGLCAGALFVLQRQYRVLS